MIECRACGHDRLLHDSWGCKMKCGCGVSIIYLTPLYRVREDSKSKDSEVMAEGDSLVAKADAVEELHVREMFREMFERSISERFGR